MESDPETILKYLVATDTATTGLGYNDTFLRNRRSTRRGEIPMDPIRYRASDDFPIVHIRVSSQDQNEDRQLVAMWNKVYR